MKHFLFSFIFILATISVKSQIAAGDIAFIGYNEDLPIDGFAIITLNTIPGSSTIYFSDQGLGSPTSWVGNGEDHWLFTAPSGGIPCGTIISFTENAPDVLTITGVSGATMVHVSGTGLFNLSGGDQMIAYTGSTASPTFIAGLTSDDGNGTPTCLDPITGWSASGGCIGTSVNRSHIPSGLTNGVNCISLYPVIGTELDNSKYIGTLTGTAAELRAAINNAANWDGNDAVNYNISPAGFGPTSVSCAPLPVELVDFEVGKSGNNEVKINWSTATEVNNDFFEIQNSEDGKHWHYVSKIKGSGNTTSVQQYTFFDKNPLRGTSYYRLKQVDFDGKVNFSMIQSISFFSINDKGSIQIYPNPAGDEIRISGGISENTKVDIFNVLGNKMPISNIQITGAVLTLDISHFLPGIYIIDFHGNKMKFTKI